MPKATLLMRAERERDNLKSDLKVAAHREVADRDRIAELQENLQERVKELSDLGKKLYDMETVSRYLSDVKDELGIPRNTPHVAMLQIIKLHCLVGKLQR